MDCDCGGCGWFFSFFFEVESWAESIESTDCGVILKMNLNIS